MLLDPKARRAQITDATMSMVKMLKSTSANCGQHRLVGPIFDGHTFGAYRAMDVDALDENDLYDFESSLRLDWSVMHEAGFYTIAEYRSSIGTLSTKYYPKPDTISLPADCVILPAYAAGMSGNKLLETIYDISTEAFKDNLFYTEIGLPVFKSLYGKTSIQGPDTFIYLARVGMSYAGFVYAFYDRPRNALIAKSIAVRPSYRRCYLARAMMATLIHDVCRLFVGDPAERSSKLIHAYYHSDNVSRYLAQSPAIVDLKNLRSYRLFAYDKGQSVHDV